MLQHSLRLLPVLHFVLSANRQTFALTSDPDIRFSSNPPRSQRDLVVSDLFSRFSSGCLPRSAALTRLARPAGDVACHTAAAESG